MIKYLSIVFALVAAVVSCAPERPAPAIYNTKPVLSLQIIDVIGPSVGSNRPLSSPRDIVVNRLKEVFIADYGNDRIIKLDSTFSYVTEQGGFGGSDYSLSGPVSIAIDNASNVYVIDSGNARVLRFDRRLNFISDERGYTDRQKNLFIRPSCIDITERGDIFIGDDGLESCFKLDPFFVYIYEFGRRDGPNPIGFPAQIEYEPDGRVYVADSEYGRIMVFDDLGVYIMSIGEQTLEKPSAVAVSERSGVWVTDMETGMLHCFDFHGNEVFRWSGQGTHNLISPAGLFIDSDDTLYLIDKSSSQIFVAKPVLRE